MREGKKTNGVIFYSSYSIYDFFFTYNCYGYANKLYSIINMRIESKFKKKLNDFGVSKSIAVFKTLDSVVPSNKDLKKKHISNVFILDLINSYRGFRHAFGLPTRGQRT